MEPAHHQLDVRDLCHAAAKLKMQPCCVRPNTVAIIAVEASPKRWFAGPSSTSAWAGKRFAARPDQ
jgi:hypothetical protein